MGVKCAFGRGNEQAEQWECRKESWREKARGESGGVRSSPMPMSSPALISILPSVS